MSFDVHITYEGGEWLITTVRTEDCDGPLVVPVTCFDSVCCAGWSE